MAIFRSPEDDYTEEELAILEEEGLLFDDPYDQQRAMAVLGSGVQGAATGAQQGAKSGGAPGAVIGGIAGFAGGLATGEMTYSEQLEAEREAILRDAELERRLAEVDNLAEYTTAVNVGAAGQQQQAAIDARQAAARGGLGAAQGQALAQGAQQQQALAQSQRLAAAVGAAGAADAQERQAILMEERIRQDLMTEATAPVGIEAQGDMMASAMEIAAASDAGEVDTATTEAVTEENIDAVSAGKGAGTTDTASAERTTTSAGADAAYADTILGQMLAGAPVKESPEEDLEGRGMTDEVYDHQLIAREEDIAAQSPVDMTVDASTGEMRPATREDYIAEARANDYSFDESYAAGVVGEAQQEDRVADRESIAGLQEAGVSPEAQNYLVDTLEETRATTARMIERDVRSGRFSGQDIEVIRAKNPKAMSDPSVYEAEANRYEAEKAAAAAGEVETEISPLYKERLGYAPDTYNFTLSNFDPEAAEQYTTAQAAADLFLNR